MGKMKVIIVVGMLGVLGALAYFITREDLSLHAFSAVTVFKSIDDTYSTNLQIEYGKIEPNTSVEVLSYRYLKDDMVFKVQLSDKKKGYVREGKFEILEGGQQIFNFGNP